MTPWLTNRTLHKDKGKVIIYLINAADKTGISDVMVGDNRTHESTENKIKNA